MKKILMALAMTGFTWFSAEAQTDGKKNCEVVQNEVCTKAHNCYSTKYAENFKVCKDDRGYFICCEERNYYNSTNPGFVVAGTNDGPSYPAQDVYTVNNSRSYEGYYPQQKSKIKACYTGNNVAELNRAPYHGCPTPAYDGPEKNKYRNMNVVTQ